MQNKKTLLQRLLVIYITFFIVLVASIAHSFVTDFYRGATEGVELGEDLAEKWSSGSPRMIYMLDTRILKAPETLIEIPSETPDSEVRAEIRKLCLTVEKDAPDASPLSLAFHSIGGSVWLYFMIMLCPLFYLLIIIFMFMIIHSLRRSIREERTLDKKNVWYLRAIGLLTIASELIADLVDWIMSSQAAQILTRHGYVVDTNFHISYSIIIMGILILFAAEVFAIGQNLSEEQKLTI